MPTMLGSDSDMRVTRKLQAIHKDLDLVAKQGNVEGFFRNLENADRFSGLVEDIRDAMVEYQVRLNSASLAPLIFASDFIAARYL